MDDDNSYVYEGSDAEEEEYAYSDGDDDAGIAPVVLPQVRWRVDGVLRVGRYVCSHTPSPVVRPSVRPTAGGAERGLQDHRQR